MVLDFLVDKETDIKSFLLGKKFSQRIINSLLTERKNLFINDKCYCGNFMLNVGDKLKVIILDEKCNVFPIKKDIDIIYEDDFFLVVNKPKGLSVMPSKAHFFDNLSSRVKNYFDQKKYSNIGIHIINRLDLLTSGIVLFAKNKFIHLQMENVKICKKYKALVNGILQQKEGIVTAKIDRANNSIKRLVSENGKTAITKYKVIKEIDGNSLVDIELLTGRTHQIRVHFSHIGNPLVDDILYNDKAITDKNFYLQSYYLSFHFPFNNKDYEFSI